MVDRGIKDVHIAQTQTIGEVIWKRRGRLSVPSSPPIAGQGSPLPGYRFQFGAGADLPRPGFGRKQLYTSTNSA